MSASPERTREEFDLLRRVERKRPTIGLAAAIGVQSGIGANPYVLGRIP